MLLTLATARRWMDSWRIRSQREWRRVCDVAISYRERSFTHTPLPYVTVEMNKSRLKLSLN